MRTIFCLALMSLAACGVTGAEVSIGDDLGQDSTASALSLPAGEAAQVLALVNEPATGFELLNELVALDRRAAINILAHRAGPDGRYLSGDDDRFDSIAELDGVAYVGDSALLKLRAWALAHPLPVPEVVEGVAFSVDQVVAVVWGVNQASFAELDGEVSLDSRAAASLYAGKPYSTVTKMGFAPFVGASALTALRNFASRWAAIRVGAPVSLAGTFDGVTFDEASANAALSLANSATRDELVAAGLPATGAAPIVGNRPYATLAQVAAVSGVGFSSMTALLAAVSAGTAPVDAPCSLTSRCLSGLVCAGLSVSAEGLCRPSWMAGTFTSTIASAIPDGNAAGTSSSIVVSGLASVPEDIIVHLDIDHPRPADLRVTLVQPSSAESTLWAPGSSGPARVLPGPGAEYDSMVNGTWTVQIIDTQGGSVGTLRGWSLELTSRWD